MKAGGSYKFTVEDKSSVTCSCHGTRARKKYMEVFMEQA